MPFLLQRSLTLDAKSSILEKNKKVGWKMPTKVLSFWSIPQNQREVDEEIVREESEQIRKKQQSIHLKSNAVLEAEKKLQENYFTLNFSDQKHNVLPSIKTFSKVEKLLVTESDFINFQRLNSHEGKYYSALDQLQRKEEMYFHRLSISSKMQIKTRKNIFEKEDRDKRKSYSHIKTDKQNRSQCSVKILQAPSRQSMQRKKISKCGELGPLKVNLKNKSKSNDRWKLKDFYDPLLLQFQNDQEITKKLKERQIFLGGLKQINHQCQRFTTDNSLNKCIEIFGRFNDVVGSKLIKKQRKVEKVQNIFQKQNRN